jgi:hypothetical protein
MGITLRDLAPFIGPAPQSQTAGGEALARAAHEWQLMRGQDMEQAQHDATIALNRDQLAALNQREAAQLSEQQAYHQGALSNEQRKLLEAKQALQAKAMEGVGSAVEKGGGAESLRALMPQLQAQGIQTTEEVGGPGIGPSGLAAFAGLPETEGTLPTGNFAFKDGERDLGSVNPREFDARRQEQIKPMLEALVQGSRPEDVDARAMGARAIQRSPMLAADATKGLAAFNDIVNPQLRNEQSGRNAEAESIDRSKRIGMQGQSQDRLFATTAEKQMQDMSTNLQVKDTLANFNEMKKARGVIEGDPYSPTGWSAARTAFSKALGEQRLTEGDIDRAGGKDSASLLQRLDMFATKEFIGGASPDVVNGMIHTMAKLDAIIAGKAYSQYKQLREMQKSYLPGGTLEHPMAAAVTDNWIKGAFGAYPWYEAAQKEGQPDLAPVSIPSGGGGGGGASQQGSVSAHGPGADARARALLGEE